MTASSEINEKTHKLHSDLLAGSPIATAQLAELLLPKISTALTKKFSNINDDHIIQTAANEAFLYYLNSPDKFDSNRGSLISFVWQRAFSNVLNFLKENKKKSEKSVELNEDGVVYSSEDAQTIEQSLITGEQNDEVFRQLCKLLPDPIDQAFLETMMNGERDTSQFAEILGISNEPAEDQRIIVKKYKDRIKKIIQRNYIRQS